MKKRHLQLDKELLTSDLASTQDAGLTFIIIVSIVSITLTITPGEGGSDPPPPPPPTVQAGCSIEICP